MSGATRTKTPVGRLLDAFGLAVVFAVLWLASHLVPGHGGDAALIGTLGFLLLAGTLLSELVEIIGLPHLTGYLGAGALAGPHILHLIDHETVNRLTPVNTLALALIALAGGAELKMEMLRRQLKTLAAATVAQTILVLVGTAGVFFAVHGFIDFSRDLPALAVAAVAMLWGVVAIARSPSACLAVIQQTHARGPLSEYSIGFIMTSDVVVILVLAMAITIARPMVEGVPFSLTAFATLGHELLGSVALGTTMGVILAIYLRLIGRQLLVVLVALGFGVTEVLGYLHYDVLLTFIVAGFVVQNMSKQGDKLVHAVEQAGTVVYVVFFASAGAHLNVPLLRALWPIAIVLVGARVLFTFVASRIGSRFANDPPTIKKWAFAPLVSQAGVAIGIAQVCAREFPSFGRGFGDLAIAAVAMNEICGPILFKISLDRAQESHAPAPALDTAPEVT